MATYDSAVRRYRPSWRDWRLAAIAAVVYAPVVFGSDWRLTTDYGWLGPSQSTQ